MAPLRAGLPQHRMQRQDGRWDDQVHGPVPGPGVGPILGPKQEDVVALIQVSQLDSDRVG